MVFQIAVYRGVLHPWAGGLPPAFYRQRDPPGASPRPTGYPDKFQFIYPNLWNPLIFLHFPQVCCNKKLRFPLFLPLWGKTRETFYQSPPTTLSSRRAEERFASLVE